LRPGAGLLQPGGPGVQLGADALLAAQEALDGQRCLLAGDGQVGAEPAEVVAAEAGGDAVLQPAGLLQQPGRLHRGVVGAEDAIPAAHGRGPAACGLASGAKPQAARVTARAGTRRGPSSRPRSASAPGSG